MSNRSGKTRYTRRYCIVGAGPAGMVAARALLAERIPFDWYERHTDVGGIWDLDNEGTPMYRSAHFISSRYTSGFYGYPMPESMADFPSWRQIRDYLRNFAKTYALYDHVQLGVEVVAARPLAGNRWSVELSTGQTREYDGLIAAPGVTWHGVMPDLAGAAEFGGEIRHSSTFVDADEFRNRRVLVIGAGNSGVDIACDAARNADAAYLSVRRGYRFIPKHIYGIPADALLSRVVPPPPGVVLPEDPTELIDLLVGDLTRLGLPAPDHALLASHPIMNTQVLDYLRHGDLVAKPSVDHLTETGVVFSDGSAEEIDLIVAATGYEYRIPFLDRDLFEWRHGRPQLYMNIFSRELDSLYVLGFIEFAGAAYKRFDEMASLIVMDLHARETGEHDEEWRRLKRTDEPNLRGRMRYIDSPRHATYVDSRTYQRKIAELHARFDWPGVSEHSYDSLRVDVPLGPSAAHGGNGDRAPGRGPLHDG